MIKLTQGNLVLDCPVPSRLASFLPRKGDDEFMLTRYTAITCGVSAVIGPRCDPLTSVLSQPEDFNKRNYTLRPTIKHRQTELMIIITLYKWVQIDARHYYCSDR